MDTQPAHAFCQHMLFEHSLCAPPMLRTCRRCKTLQTRLTCSWTRVARPGVQQAHLLAALRVRGAALGGGGRWPAGACNGAPMRSSLAAVLRAGCSVDGGR